jgi:hypothetical protein
MTIIRAPRPVIRGGYAHLAAPRYAQRVAAESADFPRIEPAIHVVVDGWVQPQPAPVRIRAGLPLGGGMDRLSGVKADYVYRLYDAAGVVVYVGISKRLKERLLSHVRRFRIEGWDLVGFEADLMPSREAAEDREVELTMKLRPIRNVVVGPLHRGVWL